VERLLGRGGFPEVYLARHIEIDSLRVALKLLHAAQSNHDLILGRFKREASLLALLRNRHTVRLVDFGFTDARVPVSGDGVRRGRAPRPAAAGVRRNAPGPRPMSSRRWPKHTSDRNDYNSRVELLGLTQSGSSDRRWRPSLIDCNDGGVPRWCWSRWAPHLKPLVRCCGGLGARATVLRRCL
jgi:hypothetical protein